MSASGALKGLKVLDFSRVYSGPYCTMLLGDMGADIIKVEAQGKGDDTRYFYPVKDGESGYYNYFNRSKRSISLNLKDERGREIAQKLAQWADVLIENFSPGTMARLGLGYEDIKKVNPQIIYASISGFGQSGPYRDKVAYDGVAQAIGGMMSLTGEAGGIPLKTGPAISDAATGVHCALAIMSAIYNRMQNNGPGQYIDVSLMDTVFSILENGVPIYTVLGTNPTRMANTNPGSAPYNMYKSKDDYVIIATANDNLFHKLAGVMKQPELLDIPEFKTNFSRKEHQPQIDAIVEKWTTQNTTAELEKMLDAAGVPVSPIKTVEQLCEDPHIKHRNMLVELEHPVLGKVKYPGNPINLSETPVKVNRRAPLLGEHNNEILNGLGYSDSDIARLKEEKVI